MKIKVIFSKEFDSDDFYHDADPKDLEGLTFEQFSETIADFVWDNPDVVLDDMIIRKINDGEEI